MGVGYRVSRPALWLLGAIILATIGFAVWGFLAVIGGEGEEGEIGAPIFALFIFICGVIAASIVLITDAVIRKRFANRSAKSP